jgi:hypothetical protein
VNVTYRGAQYVVHSESDIWKLVAALKTLDKLAA